MWWGRWWRTPTRCGRHGGCLWGCCAVPSGSSSGTGLPRGRLRGRAWGDGKRTENAEGRDDVRWCQYHVPGRVPAVGEPLSDSTFVGLARVRVPPRHRYSLFPALTSYLAHFRRGAHRALDHALNRRRKPGPRTSKQYAAKNRASSTAPGTPLSARARRRRRGRRDPRRRPFFPSGVARVRRRRAALARPARRNTAAACPAPASASFARDPPAPGPPARGHRTNRRLAQVVVRPSPRRFAARSSTVARNASRAPREAPGTPPRWLALAVATREGEPPSSTAAGSPGARRRLHGAPPRGRARAYGRGGGPNRRASSGEGSARGRDPAVAFASFFCGRRHPRRARGPSRPR